MKLRRFSDSDGGIKSINIETWKIINKLTWHHEESNYNRQNKSYNRAYKSHEAVEIEVEIEENIEASEVVQREQFWL